MITYKRINRQYIAMSEEAVWRYLDSRSTLFVAFVQEDGYPHLTPVWFTTIDRKLYFKGGSYKGKFKLADSAKVCCACEDGLRYPDLRGVVVWGRSRVVTDPATVERIVAALGAKYAGRTYRRSEVPSDWAEARSRESKTFVEIEPERISSWDNTLLGAESA